VDPLDQARDVFLRHHARYEVAPYYVVLDQRAPGKSPVSTRIHAGYEVNVYGSGFLGGDGLSFENNEPQHTMDDLSAACRWVVDHAANADIEVIPDEESLVFNVHSHMDPEAVVCIRITHSRGLDQPAGVGEEKALAGIVATLESLGVKRN
jgi:hypothetical protein